MIATRYRSRLLLRGNECKIVVVSRIEGQASSSRNWLRHASPQLVEVEECGLALRPRETEAKTTTFGRSEGNAKWERLMYTLYKVRAGEELTGRGAGKGRQEHHKDALLLPLRVLAAGREAKDGKWLGKYYQELQGELGAMRRMQMQVASTVEKTIKRGAGVELSPSRSLIGRWIGPLTKAIQHEQKMILNSVPLMDRKKFGPPLLLLPPDVLANAALHGMITSVFEAESFGKVKVIAPCHAIGRCVQALVEMDMMGAKARRVRYQRQVLQRSIRNGERSLEEQGSPASSAWFKRWQESFLTDPNFRRAGGDTVKEELLQRFQEMKPFEVPDPAESDATIPLGSAIITESKGTAPELELKQGPQSVIEKAMRRNAAKSSSGKLARLNRFLNKARSAARDWQQDRQLKVGARLLDLMLQHCQVSEWDPTAKKMLLKPALDHYIVKLPDRRQGFVKLHDGITRQLTKLKSVKNFLMPAYQPMVIPPMPWWGLDFGGYLLTRNYVMRHRGFRAQIAALEAADKKQPGLTKVYDALTALGEVPWRINRELLATIDHAVDSESDICDLPLVHDKPILLPVKRPRFRLTGGGFWQDRPESLSFLRSLSQQEVVEGERAASGSQDPGDILPVVTASGSEDAEERAYALLNGAPNSETMVVSQEGLSEGTTISSPVRRRKGVFRRTQLLATWAFMKVEDTISIFQKGPRMQFTTAETEYERRMRRISNAEIRKKNREQFSLRCDLKLKLEVAHSFKGERAIYFPHNLDFRGRAYPMHPHLNHLGNDLCRGLLEFAKGRPLGPHGLSWLYVQIANTWGNGEDKKSFARRRQFVQDNLDSVVGSAKQPVECTWWQQAEDPWQCLAACKAVAGALGSGNPEAFVSHAPVMMDGSCNGLQHYAALGLDRPGGAAVNIMPADKPQDVYSQVAELVRERVRVEAENGEEAAALLLDQIDRKLVKQTVMTSVYGITFIGARDQIKRRLRERGWQSSGKYDNHQVAAYAAQQTLAGLHEHFRSAKLVMEWLTECAKRISETGAVVQWTTPLGLPVIQPYKKKEKRHINTSIQRVVVVSDRKQEHQPIMKLRQRSAFPPNYIHSLDSTHMMMTASACKEAGMAFAGVHDSFWTHAADVPQLNTILRDKFVELYTQPLLENLAAQFEEQGHKVPPVPPKGDLDIDVVKKSPYFFS